MQVNNYSSQVQFSAKKQEQPQMRTMSLNDFVNATDEDLYYIAQAENKQKNRHSTPKFIGACVGVDVLSNMLLKTHVKKVVNGETKLLVNTVDVTVSILQDTEVKYEKTRTIRLENPVYYRTDATVYSDK